MSKKPHISTVELIFEVAREVIATALLLMLLIPAILIQTVAQITSIIVKHRGGVD